MSSAVVVLIPVQKANELRELDRAVDEGYVSDVLLGEGHPILLTQGLVLLNGDCAVSTEVKLLKNIVKC